MRRLPPARGRFQGLRIVAVVVLVIAAAAAPCRAGLGEFAVDVRCPALAGEVEAEFEARVRVDLALRVAEGGALAIDCREREARVTWRPRAGGVFTRAVPDDGRRLVDALLVAVADVARESTARDTSVSAAVAPAVVTSIDASAEKDIAAGEPSPPTAPAASSYWPSAIGMSLGVGAAMFTNGQGTIGPDFGLLIGLPSNLVAGIHGEYGFGLGAGDVVRIRLWGATVSLSESLGDQHQFELGAGASAGAIETSVSDPYGPTEQTAPYFAVLARARYAVLGRAWRLGLGPELRVYTAPVTVSINGSPVWKLSAVSAGLTLDMSTRIYGDLW